MTLTIYTERSMLDRESAGDGAHDLQAGYAGLYDVYMAMCERNRRSLMNTGATSERLFSATEAAYQAGCSAGMVVKLHRLGLVPEVQRIGRSRVYTTTDVQRLKMILEERRQRQAKATAA